MTMQRYLGRKIITATPMTRAAYNTYRGWTMPADENPLDEGYLIELPNDPAKAGLQFYVTWAPAAQFDASHIPLPPAVPGMAPHQQRVLDEQHELAVKIVALDKFASGSIYAALPVDERIRMVAQSDAMKTYSNVLLRRIAAFNNKEI